MLGTKKQDDRSLGDVIDFVKSYAKQETVDPLKGAGRWLGYGAAAAFAMGLGLMIVLLGLLRLIQTEVDRLATGSLSWAAYAVTLVVTLILLAITLMRVKKSTLNKEPK
jgi:cytochrome c biogenesis protein CcdA